MSATEVLRALLDERGMEWWTSTERWCEDAITYWRVGAMKWTAIEGENGLWLNAGIADYEPLTPEQAIAATLGGDSPDTVKHLMKLQGGHYSWPMLYEAVTRDPFDYNCPPSKSEEVFIEKLISIVGGREVMDA